MQTRTHLEYFYNTLFVICDVDGLKNFTILSAAQLANALVIVLLATQRYSTIDKFILYELKSSAIEDSTDVCSTKALVQQPSLCGASESLANLIGLYVNDNCSLYHSKNFFYSLATFDNES